MMLLRIFISFFSLFFFCNISFAKYQPDIVIATVNNKAITSFDLQDRYRFLTKIMKIKIKDLEKEIFLNQIVDKMIDEELIRQEAARLNINLDENELIGILESLALKKGKNLSSYRTYFKQQNVLFENYENQVRADLLWSKIVAGSLRSRIKITDLEIQEFFEQQKISTDATKYLIAEIFIPKGSNAKILAQKLSTELKNGANFVDIVKQFSHSPSSENNGEIGWVSKADVTKNIYEAIRNLAKKSYSDAIFLQDGYYIFKLLDKKLVTEIKEDDLVFARNRIFTQELATEGKGYLMELQKRSYIEVNRDKISQINF